jgi:hypothetical protein
MKKCFVCMPLIAETQDLFSAIARKVIDSLGGQWTCVKANDTRRPGMIDEKVVFDLLNADLVIAVIADPREANPINPNVMYELGIAHSFRKHTIVIADIKNKLPFDIQSVETIQVDFSSPNALKELQKELQQSLEDSKVLAELEGKIKSRNPITTQLGDARIFIEDLPWIWGYCDVLKRERAATAVWEITRDLFWAGEPLFFSSIKEAVRMRRKHYFMVEDHPDVIQKVGDIRTELQQDGFSKNSINDFVHFVAIEAKYFVLWPIAIVLYDASLPTRKGGIICEPMQPLVGNDIYDEEIRLLFEQYGKPDDLATFEKSLSELAWTKRRQEATFDISLDGRVVEKLSLAFKQIWNEKILEEVQKLSGDEKSTLLNTWVIGGVSE